MQEKLFVTGRGFFCGGKAGGGSHAGEILCTVFMAKNSRKRYNFENKQDIFIPVQKNKQENQKKNNENYPLNTQVN